MIFRSIWPQIWLALTLLAVAILPVELNYILLPILTIYCVWMDVSDRKSTTTTIREILPNESVPFIKETVIRHDQL